MIESDSDLFHGESGAQNCVGVNEINITKIKKPPLAEKGLVQYVTVTCY